MEHKLATATVAKPSMIMQNNFFEIVIINEGYPLKIDPF
jgi:hypothetical protein